MAVKVRFRQNEQQRFGLKQTKMKVQFQKRKKEVWIEKLMRKYEQKGVKVFPAKWTTEVWIGDLNGSQLPAITSSGQNIWQKLDYFLHYIQFQIVEQCSNYLFCATYLRCKIWRRLGKNERTPFHRFVSEWRRKC